MKKYPNETIQRISEFLFLETPVETVDIALVFGNDTISTMEDVAKMYKLGLIKKGIILSGHSAGKDKIPECIRFYEKGVELGIPKDFMLTECDSTNTKENLENSLEIIQEIFPEVTSIMFVAKAFVTRRIEMTARALNYPKDIKYLYYPTLDERNIGKYIWWQYPNATERVLEEIGRISKYTLKGDLKIL